MPERYAVSASTHKNLFSHFLILWLKNFRKSEPSLDTNWYHKNQLRKPGRVDLNLCHILTQLDIPIRQIEEVLPAIVRARQAICVATPAIRQRPDLPEFLPS
jgi:hypothetical protein